MKKRWLGLLLLFAISGTGRAAPPPSGPQDIKNVGKNAPKEFPCDEVPSFYAKPEDVQWFKDAKFGIFVHWNPSSLKAAEISWGRWGRRPGCGNDATSGVPEEEYDSLYKQFNPTNFNADAWIRMVKESGAKYFIFTTKHHDGFCMFDAPNTDYKITNTPFKRDVCKELADACHKYGIKLFWYYSQPDWYHPDYLTPNHDRYREYMYEHLRTLLTKYGKVDGMWFDCLNTSWRHWDSPRMIKMIRKLQPGILINSRWGWGMPGCVKYYGDFDNPEQEIGKFKIDRPWETCATMGQGWSWRGGGKLMSPEACIRMLVQVVGAGGNLALDCGPRPDGMIDPPEQANYLAMGKWLKTNGESIYATLAGPYKPGFYGVSTRKGKKVYLHILAGLSPEYALVVLPALPARVKSAEMLNGKKIRFRTRDGKLMLDLSSVPLNEVDNVVVLNLDSDAEKIQPIDVGYGKVVPAKKATASSIYGKDYDVSALLSGGEGKFEAGIHRKKTWVARGNGKPQWVEIEFEKPATINLVSLAEPLGRCLTRRFNVQVEKNGRWATVYEGKQIGTDCSILFRPVKTKKVRLNILEYAKGDPGLLKFQAAKY